MQIFAADTHSAIWYLENDRRLTSAAYEALDKADRILLPSICLVEITYLVEKRRLHPASITRLLDELNQPATTLMLVPLDLGVVLAMQDISRFDVPDMPDRIVAATALHHRIPLVTCDSEIRASIVKTIW